MPFLVSYLLAKLAFLLQCKPNKCKLHTPNIAVRLNLGEIKEKCKLHFFQNHSFIQYLYQGGKGAIIIVTLLAGIEAIVYFPPLFSTSEHMK